MARATRIPPHLPALALASLLATAAGADPGAPPKEAVPQMVEATIAAYAGSNARKAELIHEVIRKSPTLKNNPGAQMALMDMLTMAWEMPARSSPGDAQRIAQERSGPLGGALGVFPPEVRNDLAKAVQLIDPPQPPEGAGDLSRIAVQAVPPPAAVQARVDANQARRLLYARLLPDVPSAQEGLALGRLQRGDFRGAYGGFSQAIGLGAATADNFYYRGLAAARTGDAAQAHRDAAAALSINPKDARAFSLFRLSEAQAPSVRAGLRPPAEDPFGRQNLAAPERDDIPERAGDLRAAPSTIEEVKRQALPEPAQASKKLTEKAETFLQVRDYRAADMLASKAIEVNPQNAQAYNLRAAARGRQGDFRAAVADASSGLALAPESVPLLHTRAWAYGGLGDYEASAADTLSILRRQPRDPYALYGLARAQSGLGRRTQMLESLKKAADADPRFRKTYVAALQLPTGADTELLFAGFDGPAPAGPNAPGPERHPLRIVLAALAGGLLIALGVLHPHLAGWRARLQGARGRPAPSAAAGTAGFADTAAAPLGSPFWSRFERRREIAVGGMGVVYEAVDKGLGRRVAVKRMREEVRGNPRERAMFLAEAGMVAALHHPNIVAIHAIVEEGPDIYLVFEYAEGKTLHDLLAERGPLPFDEALRVFRGACAALQHAHERRIIHRDLKPANIMVGPEGEAKVMDFGIARQAKDAATRLSQTNTIAGTAQYMSPEQEQGVVCRETDIYSLGVTLYETLTASLPFEGTPGAMLLAKMDGRFDRPSIRVSGHPARLDAFIEKALAPDPKARWRTPSEFFSALDGLRGV